MARIYLYGGLTIVLILTVIWFYTHKRDVDIKNPILGPGVKEKVIIDSLHRKLTVITDKGLQLIQLPDRPASIEINKDGTVKVTAPQTGFEHAPFIGIGYSNKLNDYVGIDFYYWKALDLGAAVSFDRNFKIKGLDIPVLISYTIYHRLRLSIGVEPFGEHKVHGLVSVRI